MRAGSGYTRASALGRAPGDIHLSITRNETRPAATLASPVPRTAHRTLFLAAICTGSLLLFLVQPMIARMALPRLGGAPAVWNSAMLVYQALLLGGYAYAHALARLQPQRQATVHLLLFAAAALTLPIGLLDIWPPADANPVLWVPWLLAASIGPLFFVVSSQAPLLQRWFALSGGADPYPLYAASNLGSFAGLLAYPLLVEPLLPLGAQRWLWSGGYGLVALLTLACALSLRGARVEDASSGSEAPVAPRPDRRTVLHWIALAAIPSGLMLSTTLHLTTDIVAMPLIWVIPLGLYLLSFSVAFAERRGAARLAQRVAPLLLLISAGTAFAGASSWPWAMAALTLAALFTVATALHARLFDSRPAPEHLTRFYLVMSLGGMLGGGFCALLAPLIFDWTFEHPLLLLAAALLLPQTPLLAGADRLGRALQRVPRGAWLLAAALLCASLPLGGALFDVPRPVQVLGGMGLALVGAYAIGHRLLFPAALLAAMLALGGWRNIADSLDPGRMTRSYFGIYTVRALDGNATALVHGTTVHGVQLRGAGRERLPTSYYAPGSGAELALRAVPALYGPRARIDVIGLGAGALACYAQPGQRWRFYEIDPAVERIARDARHFSFLARCLPDVPVLIGDARITIAQSPPASAEVLMIDAFSSDTVPMHLLTREAFATYGRHLVADGLLVAHISNRHLDLRPVIAAAAADGWTLRIREFQVSAEQRRTLHFTPSRWVALSRDPARIAALETIGGPGAWQAVPAHPDFPVWTDDYGSILPLLIRLQ